jgi:hypothetical protein
VELNKALGLLVELSLHLLKDLDKRVLRLLERGVDEILNKLIAVEARNLDVS